MLKEKKLKTEAQKKNTYVHRHRGIGHLLFFPANFALDTLPDGELTCTLTNLRQISTRESMSYFGDVNQIYVLEKNCQKEIQTSLLQQVGLLGIERNIFKLNRTKKNLRQLISVPQRKIDENKSSPLFQ